MRFKLFNRFLPVWRLGGASNKLGEAIRARQRQYANVLQSKTRNVGKRSLLIGLVSFCILYTAALLYVVVGNSTGTGQQLTVTPITIPDVNNPSLMEKRQKFPEHDRIVVFRHYLDSLSETEGGLKKADSIRTVRPGLIDSLNASLNVIQLSK